MRLIAVYILILFSTVSISAQPKRTLFDKGFRCLVNDRDDAAFRYFKKSFKKERDDRAICLSFMADIEYRNGLIKEAEAKYKTILANYNEDNHYLQYKSYLKLADIDIKRADYQGALAYLKGSEEHKYKFGCGTGKYEQEYELKYKYALCFNGLNETDSAILKLTPYMFQDCPILTNKRDHKERNVFYFQLLLKKYGICEVRDETQKAVSNLNYSNRVDSAWTGDVKFRRVSCSLNFFGQTISIADFGFGGRQADIDKYYPREVFVDAVKRSVLYGLINGGNDL